MALYAIGEALIDFVPSRPGKPDADIRYTPAVGGAPLNVAAAYARLGGKSYILSQVGEDAFGEQIAATAQAAGVDTRYLQRTSDAKTALAFVTLHDNGEREFAFYRDPSADMLYAADNLAAIAPQPGDILHYCSVSLTPGPMREAHRVAIERFRAAGALISFDINLRLPLWPNPADLHAAVQEYLPLADILKISDDELEFVTGER
ncbi:carbohydrate kinase, partial [Cardiobacterium hominis]|uniref:carbohydrate kinase family protein n=1 Tax=Cardiobacterium hominis TaxID=2718 RepID=UPI0028E61572